MTGSRNWLDVPRRIADRVRVDPDGRDGLKLCVFEQSGTVYTEGPLNRAEVSELCQALMSWLLNPAPPLPEHWPPQVGDVWEDRHSDCWLMESSGGLVRLAGGSDDYPDEVLRVAGPMKLVWRVSKSNRAPF